TDERESVRAHMEGCLACRALATRLTQAAHALPLASEVVRPPDRLRARILAAAAASPPAEGREPAGRRPAPAPPPVAAERRRAAARLPGLQRLRFPVLVGAVAALAVALLGLAAWNVTLNQQLRQPPARYSMSGTGTLSGVSATVTAYRASDVTLVSFTGLPQPAPGRVYEMWLIDAGGRPKPAGVFPPGAGGGAPGRGRGS